MSGRVGTSAPVGGQDSLSRSRQLQVCLLTGFLGSGKTTLLRQWARRAAPGELAVIINEFAALGIDQAIVHGTGDTFMLLEGGCACCVVKDDLVDGLHRLRIALRDGTLPRLRQVVVETSGLADPSPIIHALRADPRLRAQFAPAVVLTVVDASHALMQLDEFAEVRAQVVAADRLLLSKLDLAVSELVDALQDRLAGLNPLAMVERLHRGTIEGSPPGASWWSAPSARALTPPSRVGGVARHSDGIVAQALEHRGAVDWEAFTDWLQAVCLASGRDLLRVKGIVYTRDTPSPRLVNAVHFSIFPSETLGTVASTEEPVSRLVFIGRNLDATRLQRTLAVALR